jgi:hypothetical protein
MAKKCLTAAAKKGIFIQDVNQKNVFLVKSESGSNLPFLYFRMSLPIAPHLISQGAIYMVESHVGLKKVLFTGLRQTGTDLIYYGDTFNTVTKKRSFILFKSNLEGNEYTVYLYENYYPKVIPKIVKEILNNGD